MTLINRSILCIAVLTGLSGCLTEEKIVTTNSGFTSIANEGQTLSNTPDIIIKSQNNVDYVTISIGATSDLHGRLFGYDYATDSMDSDAGL